MRKGEALALRFKDINFEDNTIKIDKTLSGLSTNINLILTPPKTPNSVRTSHMTHLVRECLLKWKDKSEKLYGYSNE